MPNVLIMPTPLRHRPGKYREVLAEAGFTPFDPPGYHRLMENDLVEAVSDVEAILAGGDPLTERVIQSAPRLRVIARAGVGFESVDLKTATARNIPVAITPGANHESVAEHTLMLILAVSRNALANDAMIRDGGWDRIAVRPIRGMTLGIVGLGRIGRAVAVRARALGMRVVAFDRNNASEFDRQFDIERLGWESVLACSDVVSLNLPLTDATRGMFNRRAFSLMRPGAIFVNTSRGGLVVEADLHEALVSGKLAGAGLDVMVSEPPDRDNPLLGLPNVLFSPHIAGVDTAALDDMAEQAARIIIDLHQGRWPDHCVVNQAVKTSWEW